MKFGIGGKVGPFYWAVPFGGRGKARSKSKPTQTDDAGPTRQDAAVSVLVGAGAIIVAVVGYLVGYIPGPYALGAGVVALLVLLGGAAQLEGQRRQDEAEAEAGDV